jgi:hypothetical protein
LSGSSNSARGRCRRTVGVLLKSSSTVQRWASANFSSKPSHGALTSAIAERLQKAGLRVAGAGTIDYLLRGTATAQAGVNRLLALNEVSLNAALTLSRPSGEVLSTVLNREESYAGNDLTSVYLSLVQQQADRVASQVYAELCK